MNENIKQESLADIIAEGRGYKGIPVPYAPARALWIDEFNSFLDRIEAAYKREIEKLNSVIQAQRSAFDAEQDRRRREQPGNMAKLCEALESARHVLYNAIKYGALKSDGAYDTLNHADAALALFTDSPENENTGADNVTAGKQELNANSKSVQIEFGNAAKDGRGEGSPRAKQGK